MHPVPISEMMKVRTIIINNSVLTALVGNNTGNNLMTTKSRVLIWLVFIGLLDALIPLFPIMTLILIYVLMERPRWFVEWVQEIYQTR